VVMGVPPEVAEYVGAAPWREWLKRFRAGRMLAALRRRRRAPAQVVRAAVADRRDRSAGRVPPPAPRRRTVRSVVWLPAGPGSGAALLDSVESVLASDGEAAQVLVVDDSSGDAREAVVRERFPEVDVVRNPRPSGGPPSMWGLCCLALRRSLERYDFEQWVKLDTDALVTGPGFSEQVLGRLSGHPRVGFAGSFGVRADGVPEDRSLHAAVLARECGSDRTLAAARERALGHGWREGDVVQCGVCVVTRRGVDALVGGGWIDWHRPWHSLVSEDLALSLFLVAEGLELVSIGAPDGIFAVANKHLPLPKEEVAGGPWVAGHSVRAGAEGEDEATLRAFFRGRRESWPAP